MKTLLKIVSIGIITTIFRVVIQLFIPDTGQTMLPQSKFVLDGTLPIVFTIYGVIVYSLLATLFLLIQSKIAGIRIVRGLRFGLALSLIWIVYLLEPLPHAKSFILDNLAYIIADSVSLLIMGILTGFLLADFNSHVLGKIKISKGDHVTIGFTIMIFVIGRLIQYKLFNIYSSFDGKTMMTILWCILVGFVSASVINWFARKSNIFIAVVIFGVNLILFNGFMVLVFDMSKLPLGWLDLVLRTMIDTLAISVGIVGTQLINKRISAQYQTID